MWEPLPIPPPPQSFPRRALSVGLASDDEDGVINFRVLIATGCDEQYEKTGTRVIPIETYSSRTRDWRISKLLSEVPVVIQTGMPPTISGGFFHWFTATKTYIIACDSSSLEEEDNRGGKLMKKKKKKKKNQRVEVTEAPNTSGCQIVWRSDNGQTMWFGSCSERDGVEVYRKRDCGDGWSLISKVECLNRMAREIIGVIEEDIKNDMELVTILDYNLILVQIAIAFKMSYIFASSSSGPNSQRRHESPRKTRSGGQRVNRHVLARVRESAPRVRANLPLQVPPPPVVIVEDPEPVVVVEDLKTMLCPDDILGICLLTADQCQYAHGLDDQHISFFENVDEFGYPYKYNRCPKGKKIKLEECVQGLNCFGRHADEPSGSECRRFKRFRHCYLDANSCLFKHW